MIIWGTTIKRRKLGWVADYCPICAKARAHRIVRVGSAGHLWYISLGSGSLVGHETTCATCEVTCDCDVAEFKDIADDEGADLDALIQETCPDLNERYAVAIDYADRVGSLSPEERQELLLHRLGVIAEQLERQYAERPLSPVGKVVGKFMTFIFVAWIATIIVLSEGRGPDKSMDTDLASAFGVVLVTCAFAMLYFMIMRHPWFMKHRLRPQLRRALAPLDPSVEELDEVLGVFKRKGLLLGKKFKAAKMHRLIEADAFIPAD